MSRDEWKRQLRKPVQDFIAERCGFQDLDARFMDAWLEHPDGELTDLEYVLWDRIYELIYMGSTDPVDRRDAADGIVGEEELRVRLTALSQDPSF